MHLFHIAEAAVWTAAQGAGEYRVDTLDREGFIHLSTETQWLRVLETFYTGREGLVLLEIEAERLTAELRFDAVGTERFPHLYGALNVDAVVRAHELVVGADGRHRVPDGVQGVSGPPAP